MTSVLAGTPDSPALRRRLGVTDAVVVGPGAVLGAGVFAALAPAAAAAGSGLLPALAVAAAVAYCNATSSARLAARHPAPGGTPALAAVHPRFRVPHRAALAVGAVVAVLAARVGAYGVRRAAGRRPTG